MSNIEHIPLHILRGRTKPAHVTATLGTKNELIAAAWLISQGYEVFRNLSPVGPVDLIAMQKDGKIIKIDVKTALPNERYTYRLSRVQIMLNVHMLIVTLEEDCRLIRPPGFKVLNKKGNGDMYPGGRY